MKICSAQITPIKGDVDRNIEKHIKLIDFAVPGGADLIIFPELSLTGYEPKYAKDLATTQDDIRFNNFQKISDEKHITIGVGMPTKSNYGILVSMIIFQPKKERRTYSKQHLHADEYPYFVNGQDKTILTIKNNKIALAICYESLQINHAENAFDNGAEIYITSVAKSANGIKKAFKHYPTIADQYSMTVMMSNSVGQCDDFVSVGKSAIWNHKGLLLAELNDTQKGLLIFDTETQEVFKKII